MNTHPLFVAGGISGMIAALTVPVGASNSFTAATYQTSVIPIELLIFALAVTTGLILFGITRDRAQAIWIHALGLLSAAFSLGCSFAYGRTMIIDATNIIELVVTNTGVLIYAGGLLVFSVIMLIYSVMAEMHKTAEGA